MASFQERQDSSGKTRYRALVRLKGFPVQTATFDRKTDAKRWAQRIETDMRAGRHTSAVQARRHTLSQMVDRYIRDVLPTKSPSSQACQATQLLWWKKKLGHLTLADVTPSVIVGARDALSEGITTRGKPRTPSTVVRYMAALSHCFTVAVNEWEWLVDSPTRKVSRPRESRGRVRFLSDGERDRLLEACKVSNSPYLYAVVVVALSTGMRRGETMGLTWGRVDLERGLITLLAENTKTREARGVPLMDHARIELESLSRSRRTDTDLVFPAPSKSGTSAKPLDIRTAWETALNRASLSDFRFHDLRHTAASYLAMNGATLVEIAAILGHRTLAMVQRYSHLTDAHTSGVVDRMNKAMFGNQDGGKEQKSLKID